MTRSAGPEETLAFASEFSKCLSAGDIVALCGDLGAGKTHFVKGLARGFGCSAEVTSPTFTLIHEYAGGCLPLFHADLYRLESAGEALDAGLGELLDGNGVTVVEWADKFPELFPAGTRWVRLRIVSGDVREIGVGDRP